MPHPLADPRSRISNPSLVRALVAARNQPPAQRSEDDGLYERCSYCPRYFELGRVCPICSATPGFLPIGLRRGQMEATHCRAAELDRLTAAIADAAEAMDVTPAAALARAIELLEETLWNQQVVCAEDAQGWPIEPQPTPCAKS